MGKTEPTFNLEPFQAHGRYNIRLNSPKTGELSALLIPIGNVLSFCVVLSLEFTFEINFLWLPLKVIFPQGLHSTFFSSFINSLSNLNTTIASSTTYSLVLPNQIPSSDVLPTGYQHIQINTHKEKRYHVLHLFQMSWVFLIVFPVNI